MDKFKILVPIDFTSVSDLAVDLALELGHTHQADIYLFHVHEGSSSNFRELDRVNEEIMEKMKAMVLDGIQRAAQHGITRTVEEVFLRMSNGKAWIEIVKMAGNINCDMIIMGYHAKGKVWEKVLKKTPCTVVLTREKDPDFVWA